MYLKIVKEKKNDTIFLVNVYELSLAVQLGLTFEEILTAKC